jgi:hypothetical protein
MERQQQQQQQNDKIVRSRYFGIKLLYPWIRALHIPRDRGFHV